jgi:hypothetical protein
MPAGGEGTVRVTLGDFMRKSALLLAAIFAVTAPSLAMAKAKKRAAPPPPPPVASNEAGTRLIGNGLRAFLVTPFEVTFGQPAPQPVSAPKRKKAKVT